MNGRDYEPTRRRVAEAIRRALPTSPDDGTVVIRFDREGIPTWGHPSTVVEMVTTEVMRALFHESVFTGGTASKPGRWGCGCDSRQCRLREDVFSDGTGATTTRITCIDHSLVARGAGDGGLLAQRQMAMQRLDLAHQEQCR